MRILHTIDSLDPVTGGPARSVPALAMSVAACGCCVGIRVGTSPPQEVIQDLGKSGVTILQDSLSALPTDWSRPDIIHDHGAWLPSNHASAGYARKHSIPWVVSPRGMLEPWALNHKRWKKRFAWWLYERDDLLSAAVLHATADSEAENLRYLKLNVRITIIPNGVDGAAFTSQDKEQEGVDCGRTALFLSRIHPKKGLPLLVEAWARVRPPGWTMRVIGPDESGHMAVVKRLVKQKRLESCWEFQGPLDGIEKRRALVEGELFILPTHSENFGIAITEALAAGTPVITTTGAPWAGLEKYGCGWWVSPTVESLAEALREATTLTGDRRREMGRRGREWMKREFSWDAIGKAMLDTYENILSGSKRR